LRWIQAAKCRAAVFFARTSGQVSADDPGGLKLNRAANVAAHFLNLMRGLAVVALRREEATFLLHIEFRLLIAA
jgi:hypothetical protein